ncbi:MAG: hypothetical protein MRQ07_02780 [Candidatus Midichloria sp.]|nr:hypothetical protein [Candidatus Midichloria sp.]
MNGRLAYNRTNAYLISQTDGQANYGGAPSDISIIRYLQELKRRKLNIMLLPMFFIDAKGKPWRGRLTGTPTAVVEFFNRKGGGI